MIIKVVVLAIAIALLTLVIKTDFKSGAVLLSVAGCLLVFSISVDVMSQISRGFRDIELAAGVNADCLKLITKMLAVAYAASFGADICTDAGEKALANAVESVGKLMMLAMAFPMLLSIFQAIAGMVG